MGIEIRRDVPWVVCDVCHQRIRNGNGLVYDKEDEQGNITAYRFAHKLNEEGHASRCNLSFHAALPLAGTVELPEWLGLLVRNSGPRNPQRVQEMLQTGEVWAEEMDDPFARKVGEAFEEEQE